MTELPASKPDCLSCNGKGFIESDSSLNVRSRPCPDCRPAPGPATSELPDWQPLHPVDELAKMRLEAELKDKGEYIAKCREMLPGEGILAARIDAIQAELAKVRKENERLKFEAQCGEERAANRGFLNLASPTAMYERALQEAEKERDALKARLAEIDAGAKADADDLAKMRDGTKLTRSGVVEIIVYQQQELTAIQAELAEARRERDEYKSAFGGRLETERYLTNELTSAEQRLAEVEGALKAVIEGYDGHLNSCDDPDDGCQEVWQESIEYARAALAKEKPNAPQA